MSVFLCINIYTYTYIYIHIHTLAAFCKKRCEVLMSKANSCNYCSCNTVKTFLLLHYYNNAIQNV